MEFTLIPIDSVVSNTFVTRRDLKRIDELAESIKEHGVLAPLLVLQRDEQFEIIDGGRRFRAARLAGLTDLPAIVQSAEDQQAATLSVIANLQRDDLTPLDEAAAFEALQRLGLSQTEIAAEIVHGQSYVVHKLALRRHQAPVLALLERDLLSEAYLRQLARIEHITGSETPATFRLPIRGGHRSPSERKHGIAGYQHSISVPNLLVELAPVGVTRTFAASLFEMLTPDVHDYGKLIQTYVARHLERPLWVDAAAFFGAAALQDQWTSRRLEHELTAWKGRFVTMKRRPAAQDRRTTTPSQANEREDRLPSSTTPPLRSDMPQQASEPATPEGDWAVNADIVAENPGAIDRLVNAVDGTDDRDADGAIETVDGQTTPADPRLEPLERIAAELDRLSRVDPSDPFAGDLVEVAQRIGLIIERMRATERQTPRSDAQLSDADESSASA